MMRKHKQKLPDMRQFLMAIILNFLFRRNILCEYIDDVTLSEHLEWYVMRY